MATLKISVREHKRRKDGKYPVSIRLTHHQQAVYIPTGAYVSDRQLNKALEVKDTFVNRELDKRVELYERLILALGLKANAYSAKELADYLVRHSEADASINFFEFAERYVAEINVQQPGTAENHINALNNLERYLKVRKLSATSITANFLHKYHDWMRREGGKNGNPLGERGQSLYLGSIRTMFNEAQRRYNDYDKGDIPIPNRPFEAFKIPKARPIKTAEDKALSVEQLKAIRDYAPRFKRDELARDCFMLSFYLCGMNSVDLFRCAILKESVLTYFRSKVRDNREDKAEMRIQVEPEALPLLEKYSGLKTVFSFCERHASKDSFNARINAGLKIIGRAVGVDDLEFYYARHSWATLAANDCKISVDLVDECLAHAEHSSIAKKHYIKKDWTRIFEANRKVLDLLI